MQVRNLAFRGMDGDGTGTQTLLALGTDTLVCHTDSFDLEANQQPVGLPLARRKQTTDNAVLVAFGPLLAQSADEEIMQVADGDEWGHEVEHRWCVKVRGMAADQAESRGYERLVGRRRAKVELQQVEEDAMRVGVLAVHFGTVAVHWSA